MGSPEVHATRAGSRAQTGEADRDCLGPTTGESVATGTEAPTAAGVGSKRTQPVPANHASGQACASCVVTVQNSRPSLSTALVPGVKPTATRDGNPL